MPKCRDLRAFLRVKSGLLILVRVKDLTFSNSDNHHHEHGPGHDHHDAVKLIAGSGQSANDRCVPQSSSDHSLHSHNVIIIIITNIAINANIQMKNNASMTKNYPNCMAVVGQVVSAGASYEPSV